MYIFKIVILVTNEYDILNMIYNIVIVHNFNVFVVVGPRSPRLEDVNKKKLKIEIN